MTTSSDLLTELDSPFGQDVLEGLSQAQKTLPCKWFYDERGSNLFEEITRTPEYYPTRVETGLLYRLVPQVARLIPGLETVIEPGSGSSIKTRILLQALPELRRYIPLDISEEFLLQAAIQLRQDFPRLQIMPMVKDFTAPMQPLALDADSQRMVFFPGSTIGNFAPHEAHQLLRNIRTWSGNDAWLLIGVDMTQDEHVLLSAYNDAAGITAQFNKNILLRANHELDADFRLDGFHHSARFNRPESRIEMHLVSDSRQQVHIGENTFGFEHGETIHTENCYKYSRKKFETLALACGWQVQAVWQEQDLQMQGLPMPQHGSNFGVFLLKAGNAAI